MALTFRRLYPHDEHLAFARRLDGALHVRRVTTLDIETPAPAASGA